MNEVIYTDNLSKHYGKLQAAQNISLSVKKGEIYGFLGLNGAGKTTTIRMLLGMIRPTSGTAYLNGKKVDAGNHSIWNSVGYIVEVPYSYPELTVRENLEIMRKLRGISDKGAVSDIISKLRLDAYSSIKCKHLSLGNVQRLGLAKALLHNPSILILDEPSNSLDPAGIVEIRELLLDLAGNHGVTVFISSHVLGEISKFASGFSIIHKGNLIQEVDSIQLKALLHRHLILNTVNKTLAKAVLSKYGYHAELTEDNTLEINNKNAINHPEEVASILVNSGCAPTQLKVEVEDLESYFLRVIEEIGGNRQ